MTGTTLADFTLIGVRTKRRKGEPVVLHVEDPAISGLAVCGQIKGGRHVDPEDIDATKYCEACLRVEGVRLPPRDPNDMVEIPLGVLRDVAGLLAAACEAGLRGDYDGAAAYIWDQIGWPE